MGTQAEMMRGVVEALVANGPPTKSHPGDAVGCDYCGARWGVYDWHKGKAWGAPWHDPETHEEGCLWAAIARLVTPVTATH